MIDPARSQHATAELKRIAFGVGALVALAIGCAAAVDAERAAPHVPAAPVPWTHLDFDDDPDAFSFAIVTDLQGGYREGVFDAAVERLNLVRPEFVVSVGDFIAGYTEDVAEIDRQWDDFEGMAKRIDAPFFYTPGNHDYSNQAMADVWKRRYGADYYHFVHRGVLFLVLNTEEPPVPHSGETRKLIAELRERMREDPVAGGRWAETKMDMAIPGVSIGDEQVAYFEKVIAENPDVRWTFLLMHKPAFQGGGDPQLNRIFTALGDRPYTAFGGHVHNYRRFEVGPRVHYRLGSTGGVTLPLPTGNMDHFVWVTMTEGTPTIANFVLDGILDDRGPLGPGDRLWRSREAR